MSLGTSTTVNNADGGVILARRSPRIVWQRQIVRDYGAFQGAHGIGSSLAQTSDAVFVLVQHGGPSYLLAVDKTDGRTRFKLDRPEKAAWTTPILSRSNGREEILVSANGRVAAIDAASGKEIWQVTGVPRNLISSPSATKEMVVVGAMEKTGSIAIARDGNGDVTQTHVLWTADATADYASPLVTDACVYFINQAGGLTCADPKTGAALWKYRLPGEAWVSRGPRQPCLRFHEVRHDRRPRGSSRPGRRDRNRQYRAFEPGKRVRVDITARSLGSRCWSRTPRGLRPGRRARRFPRSGPSPRSDR